ncbi:MAG: DUF2029 domain-containing protein [Pseudonocardiaceae bacterium]|nr:DUF2029 domain-containing protein [Pseudonocardiaceae bacterium]
MATTTDQTPSVENTKGGDGSTLATDGSVLWLTPSGATFPWRTIALGAIGSAMIALAAVGAGGVLISDPLVGHGPLSWVRYGHGRAMAIVTLYAGFALAVWAWVRLGRHVLAGRVGAKPVLVAAGCWMAPLVFSPPVFTRDVFSYIGQGMQTLLGHNPYDLGPIVLENMPVIVQNVHPFWQTTPAPYGPLFLLIAKSLVSITGNNMIFGVILMRLSIMTGLGLVLWALPRLCQRLGGRLPVALWLALASPLTVVHLVGGPHNEALMIGFLAFGVLMMLERKHVLGIGLVTAAMAVKATAGFALPFMVWIWARHLDHSSPVKRFLRAGASAVTVFLVVFTAITFATFGWPHYNLGWLEGLEAPTRIVNYLNIPTGIGELAHTLFGWLFTDSATIFVNVVRALAMVALLGFVLRQWWLARDGGTDAVRRTAMVLLAVAILSPPTLPWYLTWGFTLAAAMPWKQRHLATVVGVSVFLTLTYTPAGEDQMYTWPLMLVVVAASIVASRSLLQPDPLGLFRNKQQVERQDAPAADASVAGSR